MVPPSLVRPAFLTDSMGIRVRAIDLGYTWAAGRTPSARPRAPRYSLTHEPHWRTSAFRPGPGQRQCRRPSPSGPTTVSSGQVRANAYRNELLPFRTLGTTRSDRTSSLIIWLRCRRPFRRHTYAKWWKSARHSYPDRLLPLPHRTA